MIQSWSIQISRWYKFHVCPRWPMLYRLIRFRLIKTASERIMVHAGTIAVVKQASMGTLRSWTAESWTQHRSRSFFPEQVQLISIISIWDLRGPKKFTPSRFYCIKVNYQKASHSYPMTRRYKNVIYEDYAMVSSCSFHKKKKKKRSTKRKAQLSRKRNS